MNTLYRYQLRPAYNSDELLLEFFPDSTDVAFVAHLLEALASIAPRIESETNYMNGERILTINSSVGGFSLEIDSWGFAFLMASENQSAILMIDSILSKNPVFRKEEVDFNKYRR